MSGSGLRRWWRSVTNPKSKSKTGEYMDHTDTLDNKKKLSEQTVQGLRSSEHCTGAASSVSAPKPEHPIAEDHASRSSSLDDAPPFQPSIVGSAFVSHVDQSHPPKEATNGHDEQSLVVAGLSSEFGPDAGADDSVSFDQILDTYEPYDWAPRKVPDPNRAGFRDDIPKAKRGRGDTWAHDLFQAASANKHLKLEYRYTELKPGEIRLLYILRGKKKDEMKCYILRRKLDNPKVYRHFDALSYHWGDGAPSHEIWLIEDPPVLSESEMKILKGADPDSAGSSVPEHAKLATIARLTTKVQTPKWFKVRDNLWNCLHALRREDREVLLWIDAICINQDVDSELFSDERDDQIAMMAKIYSSAYSVCIWLGNGDDKSNQALEFVYNVINIPKLKTYVDTDFESHRSSWEALREIMTAKWFSRRWVVQEICLASKASVHVGDKIVNWEEFADAIALFMENIEDLQTKFPDDEKFRDIEALGAHQLITTISNISHRTTTGYLQRHIVGLEALVCTLLFFETKVPHDVIFSLLAIAGDSGQSSYCLEDEMGVRDSSFYMGVNYKQHAVDLFVKFTEKCVKTSGSIDIICRYWAPDLEIASGNSTAEAEQSPKNKLKPPSWIQTLSNSPFGKAKDALRGRRGGDSLVGCPYQGSRKTYNAAKNSKALVHFGGVRPSDDGQPEFDPSPNNRTYTTTTHHSNATTDSLQLPKAQQPSLEVISSQVHPDWLLHVRGFEIASVDMRSDRITNGNIPAKWLKLAGWDTSSMASKSDIPDQLWRTLVADRAPNGQAPPRWYKRACQYCLNDPKIMTTTEDMNTRVITESDIMRKFLTRVRNVVWNRQFFTAGKYFGLMPEEGRRDDIICILEGCTVPVVLHPVVRERTDRYVLVGEAFVYGAMDGEAFPVNDEDSRPQWFTLQ